MTPDQLTTALEYLNTIDREFTIDKRRTYEAIDKLHNHLIDCVNGNVEYTSTENVFETAKLRSLMGTADPRNETPGKGVFAKALELVQQKFIAKDTVDDD